MKRPQTQMPNGGFNPPIVCGRCGADLTPEDAEQMLSDPEPAAVEEAVFSTDTYVLVCAQCGDSDGIT